MNLPLCPSPDLPGRPHFNNLVLHMCAIGSKMFVCLVLEYFWFKYEPLTRKGHRRNFGEKTHQTNPNHQKYSRFATCFPCFPCNLAAENMVPWSFLHSRGMLPIPVISISAKGCSSCHSCEHAHPLAIESHPSRHHKSRPFHSGLLILRMNDCEFAKPYGNHWNIALLYVLFVEVRICFAEKFLWASRRGKSEKNARLGRWPPHAVTDYFTRAILDQC